MMDPIDVGMHIHAVLMERIGKHVVDPKEFLEIARMTDCLVGSAQVRAVENGLDAPPDQYRSLIREKLQSLGMMPMGESSADASFSDSALKENLPLCLCSMNEDGHCAACSAGLTEWLTSFAELQATYVKKIDDMGSLADKVSCEGCRAKYADVTMSKIFLSTVYAVPQQNVVVAMFNALQQVVATLGASQTPLLIKAYSDLCRERGW